MSTRIGCDNLVAAKLLTDTGSAATWDTVFPLTGVKSISISPNSSDETLFLDDGPAETATTLGKIEVTIAKGDLTTDQKAFLLGHSVDTKGGLVSAGNDNAPWLAIGFRTLKSNGKYRYVWLYKGKFAEPDDKNETKTDKVTFQEYEVKGSFVRLDTSYTVDSAARKPWKYEMDEDYAQADPSVLSTWFSAVKKPNDPTDIDVSSVTLNKDTTSIVVGATEQLTATIAPADATLKDVTWSTSDATKATVSAAGLVTGIAAGSATITVTSVDETKTDTCAVTVTAS